MWLFVVTKQRDSNHSCGELKVEYIVGSHLFMLQLNIFTTHHIFSWKHVRYSLQIRKYSSIVCPSPLQWQGACPGGLVRSGSPVPPLSHPPPFTPHYSTPLPLILIPIQPCSSLLLLIASGFLYAVVVVGNLLGKSPFISGMHWLKRPCCNTCVATLQFMIGCDCEHGAVNGSCDWS